MRWAIAILFVLAGCAHRDIFEPNEPRFELSKTAPPCDQDNCGKQP
jgi:hypothetical protein